MSTLPDEVKTFIVQQLACFDTPSVVAAAVRDAFDVVVTRQAVEAYDPHKVQGQRLSDELRQIFETTRERFLDDTAAIGVSHRTVRLRRLQRLADKAEAMNNMALAASLLEQIAKECGNAFTNKREVGGIGGGAIQAEVSVRPDLRALDQKARDALRLVAEQLAGRSAGDAPGA